MSGSRPHTRPPVAIYGVQQNIPFFFSSLFLFFFFFFHDSRLLQFGYEIPTRSRYRPAWKAPASSLFSFQPLFFFPTVSHNKFYILHRGVSHVISSRFSLSFLGIVFFFLFRLWIPSPGCFASPLFESEAFARRALLGVPFQRKPFSRKKIEHSKVS